MPVVLRDAPNKWSNSRDPKFSKYEKAFEVLRLNAAGVQVGIISEQIRVTEKTCKGLIKRFAEEEFISLADNKKFKDFVKINFTSSLEIIVREELLIPVDIGHSTLGRGASGIIKFIDDDQEHIIKVQSFKSRLELNLFFEEYKIAKKLGLAVGYQIRVVARKFYIVQKYCGISFNQFKNNLVAARADGALLLSPEKNLFLALKLTNEVANLHRRGFLHNDIHEGNCVVIENTVSIVDYGLTREAGKGWFGGYELPKEEYFANKRNWHCAPETLYGNNKFSFLSDVYSLGALLYPKLAQKYAQLWYQNEPIQLLPVSSNDRNDSLFGSNDIMCIAILMMSENLLYRLNLDLVKVLLLVCLYQADDKGLKGALHVSHCMTRSVDFARQLHNFIFPLMVESVESFKIEWYEEYELTDQAKFIAACNIVSQLPFCSLDKNINKLFDQNDRLSPLLIGIHQSINLSDLEMINWRSLFNDIEYQKAVNVLLEFDALTAENFQRMNEDDLFYTTISSNLFIKIITDSLVAGTTLNKENFYDLISSEESIIDFLSLSRLIDENPALSINYSNVIDVEEYKRSFETLKKVFLLTPENLLRLDADDSDCVKETLKILIEHSLSLISSVSTNEKKKSLLFQYRSIVMESEDDLRIFFKQMVRVLSHHTRLPRWRFFNGFIHMPESYKRVEPYLLAAKELFEIKEEEWSNLLYQNPPGEDVETYANFSVATPCCSTPAA